jgi:hypothetical protein
MVKDFYQGGCHLEYWFRFFEAKVLIGRAFWVCTVDGNYVSKYMYVYTFIYV